MSDAHDPWKHFEDLPVGTPLRSHDGRVVYVVGKDAENILVSLLDPRKVGLQRAAASAFHVPAEQIRDEWTRDDRQ
jgi:hypothetical protein